MFWYVWSENFHDWKIFCLHQTTKCLSLFSLNNRMYNFLENICSHVTFLKQTLISYLLFSCSFTFTSAAFCIPKSKTWLFMGSFQDRQYSNLAFSVLSLLILTLVVTSDIDIGLGTNMHFHLDDMIKQAQYRN